MSVLGMCLGAAMVTQAIRQYLRDEETRIKRKMNLAFERAGFFIKVQEKGKQPTLLKPKFQTSVRMVNGWFFQYYLPIGLTISDVEKIQGIIEAATESEMVAWMDGQLLYMELFTEKIPEVFKVNDELLKPLNDYQLALVMGKGRRGLEVLDYSKIPTPHMLIAGLPGMGKSNALNWIILQLLRNNLVRLHLADPKRVEFSDYRGLPQVERVEVEPVKIRKMVSDLVKEMNHREKILEQSGFKNILLFNKEHEKKMTFIFCIVDEIADFPPEDKIFWDAMIELGRKGRSAGIYLITATQRPSADIVPMAFRSNLGLKLAFKVNNLSNSKILIESDAAFRLPMKSGRAILDLGQQRVIQVPEITSKQLGFYLSQVRNGLHEDQEGTNRID